MLVRYKSGNNKITKDFTSIEIVCEKNATAFSPSIYSIIGVYGREKVVLVSGLSEEKAIRRLAEIKFACENAVRDGGIYYA
ncbi:MAG: hypothetical protein RR622_08210 [Hydrogenoanaerobacterium sp.]